MVHWYSQSSMAIKAMLREAYSATKILYYRGDMQALYTLGLTVVEGGL